MDGLIYRRRLLLSNGNNPYSGFKVGWFQYGTSFNKNSFLTNKPYNPKKTYGDNSMFITPIFDLTNGHTYKFPKLASGCNYGDCARTSGGIFKPDGACHTAFYRGGGLINYTFVADENKTAVCFINLISEIDNFYLLDSTDGVYVYKGKNII